MAFSAVCMAAAIGMNVHLPPSDTLDLCNELGSEWIRIDFNWDVAEPQQGQYDWALFDTLLDAAKARKLKVYATIGYTPKWASTGDTKNDGNTNDVPNAAAYAAFVKAATARYADGRVAAWGTWNEPNLGDFFEGSMQQWIDSAFVPAVDAIKQGCPNCLIVGPELASISDQYANYLQAALAARGNDLDAVSWHIYASFPEDDAQAGLTKDSFYNKLDAHRVLKVGPTIVWEGPLSVHEVLTAKGFGNLPVWITETGKEASVGNATELEAQRKFVERVMQAQNTRAWWQRTFIYEISEEHPGGLWPDIHWGLALRTADPDATYSDNFQRKPAFDDLKTCIAQSPTGSGGSGGASGTGGSAGTGASGGAGAAGGAAGSGANAGDGGVSGGGTNPGGTNAGGTSAGGASAGGASGAAGAGDTGAGGGAARPTGDDGGCGCNVPGSKSSGWLALALCALGLGVRRRKD